MKLSDFNFDLPEELIAQQPLDSRDDSRLLVLHRKTGEIEHRSFKDILSYFTEGDIFAFNDTRVFPAKLTGNKEKTGAKIKVFLLRELNEEHKLWDVLVDPARKIRIGNKLYFGEDDSLVAEVIDNTTSRGRTLRFLYDGDHEEFKRLLFSYGQTPVPNYIVRDEPDENDVERYQCLFAKYEGAVAAPAAGLHFSRELLKRMELYGIEASALTLHIGLGNFREIDVEDLTKHRMDSERMEADEEFVNKVNKAKDSGRKVVAVGTSTLRGLESAVGMNGHIKPFSGWTNKFIFPPYDFTVANALVTNFHMSNVEARSEKDKEEDGPAMTESIMLMVAAAFGGYENVMKAYDIAVKEKYRFGAYGDAMLIID